MTTSSHSVKTVLVSHQARNVCPRLHAACLALIGRCTSKKSTPHYVGTDALIRSKVFEDVASDFL